MSVPETKLRGKKLTFFTACRENTGAYVTDSGGAYGRLHQMPEIDPRSPDVTWTHPKEGATLSTPHLLDALFKIDYAIQRRFQRWADAKSRKNVGWFEAGRTFCEEVLKLKQSMRDNPYNGQNDLSQIYVFEVWNQNADDGDDGIYAHDTTVTVFYMHTGCDARGGYGRPIFCRAKQQSDYAYPIDVVCGYYVETFVPVNEAEQKNIDRLNEHLQVGYSNCPFYQLEQAVEEWPEAMEKDGSCRVVLKTGESVYVRAQSPAE